MGGEKKIIINMMCLLLVGVILTNLMNHIIFIIKIG